MATKKKVDYKALVKGKVKDILKETFQDYEIVDFKEEPTEGFTKDTIVVRSMEVDGSNETYDVQIKIITPSAKVGNHYALDSGDKE